MLLPCQVSVYESKISQHSSPCSIEDICHINLQPWSKHLGTLTQRIFSTPLLDAVLILCMLVFFSTINIAWGREGQQKLTKELIRSGIRVDLAIRVYADLRA